MLFALQTISDENISKILADPPLIWRVIAPDDPEIYLEARVGEQPGFLARLFGAKPVASRAELPSLAKANGEGVEIDLDKAWHGLHYLLTGTAWEGTKPLNFIVSGGAEVGDIDVGYGPARVLRSNEVGELYSALGDIDENVLRERFNPEEMMNLEIYPDIWDRNPDEDDTLDYCVEYYRDLRRFLSEAVGNSMGLVVHIF
jgi:hypothetical protein